MSVAIRSLFVVFGELFFDGHVTELAGLEHFAAEFAFHVLGVFITAHHPHARVLAGFCHGRSGQLQVGLTGWMTMERIRRTILYATIVNGDSKLVKMRMVNISITA